MDFTKTLILIVALSGFFAQTIAVGGPQAHAWSLCKTTTNPQLCFKTILPHVGPNFNLYKALEIEVSETQKQVMKTTAKITSLGFTQGFPKALASTISICKEQYSNIVDSVNETVKLVQQHNAVEARFKFSAVISYLSACDGEFVNIASPFAPDAKAIFDLAGNSLDIMVAIENKDARHGAKN